MRNSLLLMMILLTASFLARSQANPDARTLSIPGHSESIKVLELNGKSYVEVEDIARLTRGSLTFNGNRIFLTLPSGAAHASAASPVPVNGFSKEFLRAGIEQLSAIREWRSTIVNSIKNNSPVSETGISELQRRAHRNLALVAAARSTEDDRNGYVLLAGEFANMQKLSDALLSKRKRLQYIDPRSIDNDPLDRRILACADSLASMASNNEFHDEWACREAH